MIFMIQKTAVMMGSLLTPILSTDNVHGTCENGASDAARIRESLVCRGESVRRSGADGDVVKRGRRRFDPFS
jgi:hypothetical protein